ncbi:MAG: DUF2891 domain-containing protein [Rhodocyclaceae bacterium]|nr:DUF2891 domain-containing protein [Rhodocyclaceae bacterium]
MAATDALPAAALCRVALDSLAREWPYRPDVLMADEHDFAVPRERHPLFHTSYDWHSCVHMHWSLLRLLHLHGDALDAGQGEAIVGHFDRTFSEAAVAGEAAVFDRPGYGSFERPYGWGWLLELQAELYRLATDTALPGSLPGARPESLQPAVARWRALLEPLALRIAQSMVDFLPRLGHPVRTGTHSNTAFACVLALDHARTCGHPALQHAITQAAHRWYGRDHAYPAQYEPGGEDFLSAGLCEAVLMHRLLDGCDFADWWHRFAPGPASLGHWLLPVAVGDATDARIVHLHGLNLSRAWCWQALRPGLPQELQEPMARAIDAHRQASLSAALDGDYVATHWLASFALLAEGRGQP